MKLHILTLFLFGLVACSSTNDVEPEIKHNDIPATPYVGSEPSNASRGQYQDYLEAEKSVFPYYKTKIISADFGENNKGYQLDDSLYYRGTAYYFLHDGEPYGLSLSYLPFMDKGSSVIFPRIVEYKGLWLRYWSIGNDEIGFDKDKFFAQGGIIVEFDNFPFQNMSHTNRLRRIFDGKKPMVGCDKENGLLFVVYEHSYLQGKNLVKSFTLEHTNLTKTLETIETAIMSRNYLDLGPMNLKEKDKALLERCMSSFIYEKMNAAILNFDPKLKEVARVILTDYKYQTFFVDYPVQYQKNKTDAAIALAGAAAVTYGLFQGAKWVGSKFLEAAASGSNTEMNNYNSSSSYPTSSSQSNQPPEPIVKSVKPGGKGAHGEQGYNIKCRDKGKSRFVWFNSSNGYWQNTGAGYVPNLFGKKGMSLEEVASYICK